MPRAVTKGPRWSHADDVRLSDLWGTRGIDKIASELGRTPCAVEVRARAMKLGPALRNVMTMRRFELTTGYNRSRIFGAAARLGLRLVRAARVSSKKPRKKSSCFRRVLVSDKQQAAILAYLASIPDGKKLWSNRTKKTSRDAWGTGGKPPACLRCSTTNNLHKCKGVCFGCYRSPR
jgi:hypothetical protein